MKKIFINENWEDELVEVTDFIYLVLVEDYTNNMYYIYLDSTDEAIARDGFNVLVENFKDIENEAVNISLVKLPNTSQVRDLVELASDKASDRDLVGEILGRPDCEILDTFSTRLHEAKKRKKKENGSLSPFSSMTVTTGDPDLNMRFFNKRMGTDFADQAKDAAKEATREFPEVKGSPNIGTGSFTAAAGASDFGFTDGGGDAGGAIGESLKEEYKDFYRIVYADYNDDDNYEFEEVEFLLKPGQTKGDLAVYLSYRLGYTYIYIYDEREATDAEIAKADELGFDTVPGNFNPKNFGNADDDFEESLKKNMKLEEAKRYVKRYYIRPQNTFASNKEEILKALVAAGDQNCSVYSLKNLADHDDVHLLKPSDIIYYYDDHVLYDKNHVQVMDYDLFVKHEEERKKVADVDTISDSEFNNIYDDRLTDADLKDKEIKVSMPTHEEYNPFAEDFDDFNAFGEKLNESKEDSFVCCICGEESTGYGNNPEPVKHEGRCCDACNRKFVIPARIEALNLEDQVEENETND